MPKKSPLQSRTIWAVLLVRGIALFWPGALDLVKEYPEVYLVADGALMIALRLLSKTALGRLTREQFVQLSILTLVLAGCSSVPQPLEPGVFYKRDIGIEINGSEYEGVVVVPYASRYELVLKPKGDLDLVLLRTCHREESVEKMASKRFWRPTTSGKYQYIYEPMKGLEDTRVCPLRIDVYEAAKQRHSWAHIDFTSPNYELSGELTCNGSVSAVNGVAVCQAKTGTVQRLRFNEPVQFAPADPEGCAPPVHVNGAYEFSATVGECLYHIRNAANKKGRLTLIGFQGVLVRTVQ